MVDTGVPFDGGVCLTPDQSLLMASDSRSQFVYSYHINPDGTLAARQPYDYLEVPNAAMRSGAGTMAVDKEGRLYVATALGVQLCDQAGLSNLVFGGANFDDLYAVGGARIYRRKLKTTGVPSIQAPMKPAAPRL
jgi:sugar lactone lactonase YvrE